MRRMFKRKIKHKYGAIRTEADGIKFPSKLEARYYQKLKLAQKSGALLFFLRQPLFDLGGGGVTYRADFIEFWKDGTVRVIDVKGMPETTAFKIKKKLVESLYPIQINIVTKA